MYLRLRLGLPTHAYLKPERSTPRSASGETGTRPDAQQTHTATCTGSSSTPACQDLSLQATIAGGYRSSHTRWKDRTMTEHDEMADEAALGLPVLFIVD